MLTKSPQRIEKMLLSLKKFDYLTVKQMQKMHGLKSNSNAYRVVKQLEPYVNVFKENNTNIYYLNKRGREVVQCFKKRTKLTTAMHYIMRNDLYIHLGCPGDWQNEIRISLDKTVVVADAHFRKRGHFMIEVDHSQKMQKNRKKIESYRRLTEKGAFNGIPGIIWVTTTPYRQRALKQECEGMNAMVLQYEDIL